MEVIDLSLPGLKLLKPRIFHDERGYFLESYSRPIYEKYGLPPFVQDNVSYSKKNVLRALHFQSNPGQAKLVRCEKGVIFDVAVDLRSDSSTFRCWEAVILNGEEHYQLYIPNGFAHGFYVLSDTALVQYKVSSIYDPKTEKSIRWNDPDLAIEWPVKDPLLSERDQKSPFFKEVFHAADLDCRR